MVGRFFAVLSFGVGTVACESIPALSFVSDDAAAEAGPVELLDAAPLDATIADGEGSPPAFDATADAPAREEGGLDDARASDATTLPDAPTVTSDAGGSCLSVGAPMGTLCCSSTQPCIGQACAHCNECNCALGIYCCATENGGGKFQGTSCSAIPTGPQCPPQ